jgi:FKBP-type peptidyl-prolyl cis-trans isomerase FkpA
LLNGDLAYSSGQTGPKEFEIGHGGVESGLEEGILLLHVGDHAKFIVPSHLAFGLLGDQNKIPQRATLVYDIELVKLK